MRLNDVFIAGEKFSELQGENISLAKLKKYPLIMMDKNTVARRAFDAFLSRVGVELTPSIEVGSWDLMKRLVEKGMGIGVIPREYATAKLEKGTLFEIKTDPVLPARSVGMLLPKNQPVSFALHSFIEYFRKEN
jgi:DNA-binding transcriptional LysR family regulator